MAASTAPSEVAAMDCTDFPKLTVSYKWVINHAKSILSSGHTLESPCHKIIVPGQSENVEWYLELERYRISFRCSAVSSISDCVFSVLDSTNVVTKKSEKVIIQQRQNSML